MPSADRSTAPASGPALLLMLGGGEAVPSATERAAAASGFDPLRLRIQSASPAVSVLGRAESARLAAAAAALRAEGVRCVPVAENATRSLPRLELAGGIAAEAGGPLLRVHGRPAGPLPGKRLLLVYGDLGRELGLPAPASPRPGDTFRQRILRAVFPAVDVVWDEGRIRVPLRGMAWRGLPGLTASAPANFIRLLELLAERSGGAALDLGFVGQDVAVEPGPDSHEGLEGADAATTALFNRYSSAAALAWQHGLYPDVPAGQLVLPEPTSSPIKPEEVFRASAKAPSQSPVPWIRPGKASRVRGSMWPWIAAGPFAFVLFRFENPIAIGALFVCGAAAVWHGLRTLRARERMRALPLSRIRSAAMGPVQLAGQIVPCAPLLAPYSRIRCGWYRFEVQERHQDSNGREGFRTLLTGGSGDMPFRLDDGTGRILVQPAGAEIDVPPVSTDIAGNQRVLEWLLPEGAPVFVAGYAQRRAAAPSAPALPDSDEVFVGAGPETPFLISQHNRERETASLTRRYLTGVLVGGAYIALALLMAILRG